MHQIREGGCGCGRVRYRVTGEPQVALVCHCTFCQRRSGGPCGISIYFDESQIEFVEGPLKMYESRSDASGRWIKTEFCPSCGTSVLWHAEILPTCRAFAGGTFDDPRSIAIEKHVWTSSAHPWMAIPDNVKNFPKSSIPQ